MTQITIYRREDANTSPRGFGNKPTYHLEEPHHSDYEAIWVEPLQVTLPDGYTVAETMTGGLELYDQNGERAVIEDDHGHPAIYIETWRNKQGKPFARYSRLDK